MQREDAVQHEAVQREDAIQHEAVQREDAVQRDREARTPKKFFGLLVLVAIFMISKFSGFWNWVLYGQPMQEQHITVLVFGFLGILALVLYFLPLIIARKRRPSQTLAIGALNASLLVIVFVISFGYDGSQATAYVLTICALVGSFVWLGLLTWACIKSTPIAADAQDFRGAVAHE